MSIRRLLGAAAGCGAQPAVSVPSGRATPAPRDMLLDPSRLPGSWTQARAQEGTWADLEETFVPCGRRAIAPGDAPVRLRVFRATDGASVSQLVVSGVDGMQSFKRFFDECAAMGKVESEPGPRYAARHGDELEIAEFAGDRLLVVSGPASRDDLREIADLARRHLMGGS